MSTVQQTNAANSHFHDSLRSAGVLNLSVIRAFCKHFSSADGLLSGPPLLRALGHKHHYFPHIEEMINDAAAPVVHLPPNRVDEGTLISYLIEKRTSEEVVDLVDNALKISITLPLSLLPKDVLSDISVDLIDNDIIPHGVSLPQTGYLQVVNRRELINFKRSKYFRDWIALIRLLEGDPLEGVEIPLKTEKQVFDFQRHEKFIPAKPELFQLPPRHQAPQHMPSRDTELVNQRIVQDGFIEDEGVKLLKRLKGRIARDDTAARAEREPEMKKRASRPDGRAKPDYPNLAELPYDEGAQIDQTKLYPAEDFNLWKQANAHRRDLLELKRVAARDNIYMSSEYSDPTPFDFRPDRPARDRDHGRRLYGTQTKSTYKPSEKVSGLRYIPLDEIERAAFLNERDHERNYRDYRPYLPAAEKYVSHVVSQNISQSSVPPLLVMPRNSAGLNLYTRGLTAKQLEKRIPLA